MSVEVKIPGVGESITSGIVSVWHKNSGDFVNAGDALFTLETDKVSTEITAEKPGVLETKVPQGQEVKIGEVVAVIDDSKAAPAESGNKAAPQLAAAAEHAEKPPLSPAVRRIVEEEKLDPNKIAGSGKGGRLTKGDALAATEARSATPAPAALSIESASAVAESTAASRMTISSRTIFMTSGLRLEPSEVWSCRSFAMPTRSRSPIWSVTLPVTPIKRAKGS